MPQVHTNFLIGRHMNVGSSTRGGLTPTFDVDGVAGGLADAFNFEQTMAQQRCQVAGGGGFGAAGDLAVFFRRHAAEKAATQLAASGFQQTVQRFAIGWS